MNASEFRRTHGDPQGDPTHAPWTPGDWDVWDHLNQIALADAASRTPSANSPAPAPAAVRSTT